MGPEGWGTLVGKWREREKTLKKVRQYFVFCVSGRKSVQSKVDCILQDVQRFSDHAKLYLYLQLPSGPSSGEKNLDLTSLSSAEHMHACTWIRNHLEEYPDTCLPKQDVYDAYKRYCDNLCSRSLSAANFGKIIREIFPNIKARRLGGRGQSKYPSVGIRRKTVVNMPPLPSLDLKEIETLVHSYNDEVMDAACALTCDWAEKILKRSFNNIVEVAQFLLQQHIISSRSAHADLVMAMGRVPPKGRPACLLKQLSEDLSLGPGPPPPSLSPLAFQAKPENNPKPPAAPPRSEAKKPVDAPAKPASSPQVNALMARLPLLLVVSPGTAPPVLAPKLTAAPVAGAVKMALSVGPTAPTMLAPGVGGPAGLVGPQGAVPVINMMPVINVAVPPMAEFAPKPKGLPGGGEASGSGGSEAGRCPCDPQKAKAPSKRPADAPGESAVRRKRGRPRKKPDEPEPPSLEKKVAEEWPPHAKEDSDIIVVTVGYEDPAAPPSPRQRAQEEDREALQAGGGRGPPPQAPAREAPPCASGLGHPARRAAVLPSQVSVIKGRRCPPPVLARGAGGGVQGPLRLAAGAPVPGSGAPAATARNSDEPGGGADSDPDLQPTDLSLGKARLSCKERSDAAGFRASSVRLHRISSGPGKGVEPASRPVTSTQAPSR
uniref:Regulatory factor X5 n=1 Tax=Varanus komodoensis TaxID=61221 RepID=A0A8D2J8A1_VARKO